MHDGYSENLFHLYVNNNKDTDQPNCARNLIGPSMSAGLITSFCTCIVAEQVSFVSIPCRQVFSV